MKASTWTAPLLASVLLFSASVAQAAGGINMNDPRRALGREGDIRVDAQLHKDTVSPGSPISITCQVQNFSKDSVAVAARVAEASYDEDTRTVTIVVGSEVPPDGEMPQMTLIAPGETKVFRTAATPTYSAAVLRRAMAAAPRFVQVKVAVLREVTSFLPLIQTQRAGQRLSDEQFERWFEANDTIFLNTLPVQFAPARGTGAETEARGGAF